MSEFKDVEEVRKFHQGYKGFLKKYDFPELNIGLCDKLWDRVKDDIDYEDPYICAVEKLKEEVFQSNENGEFNIYLSQPDVGNFISEFFPKPEMTVAEFHREVSLMLEDLRTSLGSKVDSLGSEFRDGLDDQTREFKPERQGRFFSSEVLAPPRSDRSERRELWGKFNPYAADADIEREKHRRFQEQLKREEIAKEFGSTAMPSRGRSGRPRNRFHNLG